MVEQFTGQARKAVVLAQEESMPLGHDYIGTENILLGPVEDSDGVAVLALWNLVVDPDEVRRELSRTSVEVTFVR